MSEQLHHLSIDLETYSTVSIGAAGVIPIYPRPVF